MTATQCPTLALGACMGTPAHDWRVSSWVDFEIRSEPGDESPEPVRGRSASSFFCARCLAQVDAAVLYAERPADEEPTGPAGEISERLAVSLLAEMANECAQTEVGEHGTLAAEEAELRRAALELAISKLQPPASP